MQGDGAAAAGAAGGSPAGGKRAEAKRDAQSLLPVTIKMLHEAESRGTENKFKIDGKDLAAVTIVGSIAAIDLQTTFVDYEIDDSTGRIGVKVFVDDEAAMPSTHSQFHEGMYVRVVGNLRTPFQNQRSIVAFKVLPVTDMNEISFHQLEVLACHLRNTNEGFAPKAGGAGSGAAGESKAKVKVEQGAIAGAPLSMEMDADQRGFTPMQRQVLAIFASDRNENGVSLDQVRQRMPALNLIELRKIIDFLSEEGHLYSTVDEEHYKSTNQQS